MHRQITFVAKMSLFCDKETLLISFHMEGVAHVLVDVFYIWSFCNDRSLASKTANGH